MRFNYVACAIVVLALGSMAAAAESLPYTVIRETHYPHDHIGGVSVSDQIIASMYFWEMDHGGSLGYLDIKTGASYAVYYDWSNWDEDYYLIDFSAFGPKVAYSVWNSARTRTDIYVCQGATQT